MLQSIGDKLKSQRWLAAPLLGLLALIFAAWGAYGVVNISFAPQDYGLKINGERVSTDTLNRAWQERQAQYAQALNGAALPPAQVKFMQGQLVNEYVRETVLRQQAEKDGYRASRQQVIEAYQSEKAFQVDGKFSPQAAETMLAQIGLTPAAYEAERRQVLQISQLTEGIQLSDFMTNGELDHIYALENEQREVRFALLSADKFASSKIDEAQIKAWYDAHPNDYMSPESVKLQYAVLSLDSIASQAAIKDEDLQAWYEKNKSRYSENEKRHAHHILISIGDAKDPKSDAAALAKAQQVLAEARSGKDFGELARKYSADPGSAQQGGDLGWAERNAYVAPFSDALFAMQPGQISDPVKTQFGYHIIKLDEIRPAHVLSLADGRAKIEADYRRAQAAELFGDREEQLQQKLEQGQSTDLTALAAEFGMQLGEIANFTRAGAPPLGSKPEVTQAVFSEDTLAGDKIGGPVALSDDRVALFKVLEHHAPAPQPLASVHDEVAAAVRKDASTAAAKAAADRAVKQLDDGADYDVVIKGLGVTSAPAAFIGRSDPQLPVQVREAAFNAPRPGDKPEYRSLALENGGAAVLRLSAVRAGSAGANQQNDEQLAMQFKNRDRDGDLSAYMLELEQRANIKRNPNIFQ
ncbi:MAG: peptidylprolyl isomerase [Steroidobacteraceae bacterium]